MLYIPRCTARPISSKSQPVPADTRPLIIKQGREEYTIDPKDGIIQRKATGTSSSSNDPAYMRLVQPFLPRDYPNSVHSGYDGFAKWNFVSGVSGTVASVLSTQAMLVAMGLVGGGVGGISVAATLNWIIKDGLGQLGGVVYAAAASDKFDESPKRQRLFASTMLQLSCIAEMALLIVPGWWLVIASVSNVGKNIAYLAMSATRAQLHRHLVRRDNLGDVTGKAGSQMTLASLIGTGIGILLSTYYLSQKGDDENGKAKAPLSMERLLLVVVPASLIAIYGTHRSNIFVVNMSLGSFGRGEIVMRDIARKVLQGRRPPVLLRPEEVDEPAMGLRYRSKIIAQPDLSRYFGSRPNLLNDMISQRNIGLHKPKEQYFICQLGCETAIWFTGNAQARDILKAFYHACLLQEELKSSRGQDGASDLLPETYRIVCDTFDEVWDALESAGWQVQADGLFGIGGSDDEKRVVVSSSTVQ